MSVPTNYRHTLERRWSWVTCRRATTRTPWPCPRARAEELCRNAAAPHNSPVLLRIVTRLCKRYNL